MMPVSARGTIMIDQRIRYFLTIAEAGSISEAASTLGISQSGLSRQLKQLEDYFGRPLFVRTGRGVALSDSGFRLEAAVRSSYETIDQGIDTLRAGSGIVQGSVRIAIVHTLSYYFLPPLLAKFRDTYPDVGTYLLGRGSPEVVKLVEMGRAPLGFVYDTAVTADELAVEHLFEERMCLLHHEDFDAYPPLRAGTRWEFPLITFPKYYALRRMLHQAGLDRNVVAEVDTVDVMLHLVARKLGVCILPRLVPDWPFGGLRLTRHDIELPTLRRWVVCIRHRRTQPSRVCQVLIDLAKSYAAQLPG